MGDVIVRGIKEDDLRKVNWRSVLRARPREHARTGSVTVKGYRSPTIVNAGMTINQVGARPLIHRNHTYYELGGGLFTKKQILESRRRFGEIKFNTKVSKEQVGL